MSLTKPQSVTGLACTSPSSINPGVGVQGQVVVQTPTAPTITMTSTARPKRIVLLRAVLRVSVVSVIRTFLLSGSKEQSTDLRILRHAGWSRDEEVSDALLRLAGLPKT